MDITADKKERRNARKFQCATDRPPVYRTRATPDVPGDGQDDSDPDGEFDGGAEGITASLDRARERRGCSTVGPSTAAAPATA
jgi:hypothetical protein